jgi:hypothetical protein
MTGAWRGQAQQVIGRRLVEAQDAGKSLKDLDRGITVAALLKSEVIVGADTSEHRDLFTP